ncbi:MAG: hypothetical protein RL701_6002, partial [Pseudomonadota bacterium]
VAEQVSSAVVSDAAAYARVVGCATTASASDTCAKTFIANFGKKALRRPLTAAEQTGYLALFQQGADLYDDGDDFQRGVRVTMEALFQSPKFVYRTELSPAAGAQVALTQYELASRLSYLLVNSTPDPQLMAAADANALNTPEALATHALRLLTTMSAHDTVRDFHHQWLDLDAYANKLTKDQKLYPGISPDLAPVLQNEVEQFVDAISFKRKRGFASLLSAPFSFVNRTTAAIYGVSGTFGEELQEVALDPKQRAGIVTQVGFLATRAFSNLSSPIHRGVFIQRRLLCNAIPDPPPNIPELPPLDGTKIKTTRDQVDQHTAPAACAGCHHALINPVGFGLENYDAVGRFRTQENSITVDASGTLVGTQGQAAFSDGVELAQALASAPEARACYAKSWFRYLLGRVEAEGDSCALQQITARLADDNYTALDILTDLTRTPSFRSPTAEAP